MGRIFSYEQIEAGEVPFLGTHIEAAHFIMTELFGPEYVAEPDAIPPCSRALESGMIFGSVALGAEDIRSDLDVYVNYDGFRGRDALAAIGAAITHTEQEFQIPVGITALHVGALSSRHEHHVDLGLARHLRHARSMVDPSLVYGEPIPENIVEIAAAKQPIAEYAMEYLTSKMRMFARVASHPEVLDLNAMQLAFELPSAACRKALPAMWSEARDGLLPTSEEKGFVFQLTLDTLQMAMGEDRSAQTLRHGMEQLLAMNDKYTQRLERTLKGKMSIAEYREWINTQYIESCVLAHEVAHGWVTTLRSIISA